MGGIKRFICMCLLVIGLPMAVILAAYICIDPFKTVRSYDNYAYPEPYRLSPSINKGMISLHNFNTHYADEQYNAFILGSSVSIPYPVDEWKKYLPEDARPVHFDSSLESPRSMELKLRYLLDKGVDLRYALIVIPPTWLEWTDSYDPPHINSPAIDPDLSSLRYHALIFLGFLNRNFNRGYFLSQCLGRNIVLTADPVLDEQPYVVYPLTNEETVPEWEDSIRRFPAEFYAHRRGSFDIERVPAHLPGGLSVHPENRVHVEAIAKILADAGTDYRVVIGPTLAKHLPAYDDIELLRGQFGNRFIDLSMELSYKSDADTNFYDRIHYRRPVAIEILRAVYTDSIHRLD